MNPWCQRSLETETVKPCHLEEALLSYRDKMLVAVVLAGIGNVGRMSDRVPRGIGRKTNMVSIHRPLGLLQQESRTISGGRLPQFISAGVPHITSEQIGA